jgi:hypothetical protein
VGQGISPRKHPFFSWFHSEGPLVHLLLPALPTSQDPGNISTTEFYDGLFEHIDITPTQYELAVQHYKAVASHLSEDSLCDDVYPQGSFALGTVIRPFRRGGDADYDLDIVCHS